MRIPAGPLLYREARALMLDEIARRWAVLAHGDPLARAERAALAARIWRESVDESICVMRL